MRFPKLRRVTGCLEVSDVILYITFVGVSGKVTARRSRCVKYVDIAVIYMLAYIKPDQSMVM